MQISIIKENEKNEQRVASTPEAVKLLKKFNAEILVESGSGDLSGYDDESFKSMGAQIVDRNKCLKSDICLCVRMPKKEDIKQMNKGSILVGILFSTDLFPAMVSQSLLFFSFLVATFAPVLTWKLK